MEPTQSKKPETPLLPPDQEGSTHSVSVGVRCFRFLVSIPRRTLHFFRQLAGFFFGRRLDQRTVTPVVFTQAPTPEALMKTVSEDDLTFFEAFFDEYWVKSRNDMIRQADLLDELKSRFPAYFKKHDRFKNLLILNEEQLLTIKEGIVNLYHLDLMKTLQSMEQAGFQEIKTADSGNCLFDAIWQQLTTGQKTKVTEVTGLSDHTALRAFIKTVTHRHQATILSDSNNPHANYVDIDGYLQELANPAALWGRYDIEGTILSKELGFTLAMAAGVTYEPELDGGLFVERDNQVLHSNPKDQNTVYLQHFKRHIFGASKIN